MREATELACRTEVINRDYHPFTGLGVSLFLPFSRADSPPSAQASSKFAVSAPNCTFKFWYLRRATPSMSVLMTQSPAQV